MTRRRAPSEGSRSGFCLGSARAGESQKEGALFPRLSGSGKEGARERAPYTVSQTKRQSYMGSFDFKIPQMPCLGEDWLVIWNIVAAGMLSKDRQCARSSDSLEEATNHDHDIQTQK